MAKRALPTLPDEVIIDCVMVRVPAKSVGRFRCVSKPWRSLLSSPQFVQAHLNIHKHEPKGIILSINSSEFSFCTVNIANDSSIVSRRFNGPSSPRYATLLGSCNGLVLVNERIKCDLWNLNLFNPTTLETLKIRESSDGYSFQYGLGYDSLQDDYKIVSISKSKPYNVGIYSVKMGTWRSLGNSPYLHFQYFQNAGLFVNDSIHWPASSAADRGGDTVLVAFSLAQEKFTELPLPKGFNIVNFRLTLLGGCIAIMVSLGPSYSEGFIKFWVMKDYGVQDSWTKYSITNEKGLFRYVGVLEEDEIVFMNSSRKPVSYNWKTGIWRDMVQASEPGISCLGILETRSFKESLVSPNYGH